MTADLAHVAGALARSFKGAVVADRPLGRLTTYRVGGPAALYVEPTDRADVEALGRALRSTGERVPVLVFGRGSNIVISDKGWPGVAMRLPAEHWSWIEPREAGAPGLRAGAATSLPLLANWAARRCLAGAEFLVSVPGSVGGAIKMNAGAHGHEMKDCLVEARIFDLATLETEDRRSEELKLGYRHSNLTEEHVVLEAALELRPAESAEVRARMEEYRRHRADTQPGALQNAGSVFKNPSGDHAGRLVEAAGLKGFRVGGATVSTLHANFFVAGDGASAQDVYDLVHFVRARVREEFGTELVPEIRFIGTFEPATEDVSG